MRKPFLIITIALIAAAGSGCGMAGRSSTAEVTQPPLQTASIPPANPIADQAAGYKNITCEIEGTPVSLTGGISEVEAAPGSASKIVTRYYGNEAAGDLNGDAREDVAFLLTREGGGSGTFFYLVAALQSAAGYTGTDTILLGDRIVPRSVRISDGLIVVSYADRKPEESFSSLPTVEVSRSVKVVNGKLIETYPLARITNRLWQWESTLMNDGKTDLPRKAAAFTVTLKDDGSIAGSTDCNSFSGQYQAEGENNLSFTQLVSTLKACEGSQEAGFLKALGEVNSFILDPREDRLILLLKYDTGSMIFK